MTSVSLEEKRLKQLKQQLFGKEQLLTSGAEKSKHISSPSLETVNTSSSATLIDSASLKTDLSKIILFSFFALAVQLALFFASKQGLVNFLH